MFSTMITVASTISPKSIAPTESRFADSPRSPRIATAKNSANGMVVATMIALQIAEEHPLHEEDEEDAHQHVVQHGVRRDVDEVGAVVDLLDAHAWRQEAGMVDAVDLRLHALERRQALLPAPHQHDPLDDVVVRILAGDAQARLVPDADVGDVGEQHRGAVRRAERGA